MHNRSQLVGYVLGPSEGEHLVLRGGNIFLMADPATGSNGLAMGMQQVPVGVGIPTHRHFEMDETFYVIGGGGTFMLNDAPHPIDQGNSIFIPKNAWHGFQNPDRELLLLWVVAPPGLEAFFREVAARPGVPPGPANQGPAQCNRAQVRNRVPIEQLNTAARC
jgi:quercetin dioxygenase-like cupin family protein